MRFLASALVLVAMLGLSACQEGSGDIAGPQEKITPTPGPIFVSRVEVTYRSFKDHDPTPYNGDWVSFAVRLANPDGTTRHCHLQPAVVREFGSDCPEVGSTVVKVGPSTFRAYLFGVWVNDKPSDQKHQVSAYEWLSSDPNSRYNLLATGNDIAVAGAMDTEVNIVGRCGNCFYEQEQALLFRMLRP